jgi:hypothetical protein
VHLSGRDVDEAILQLNGVAKQDYLESSPEYNDFLKEMYRQWMAKKHFEESKQVGGSGSLDGISR